MNAKSKLYHLPKLRKLTDIRHYLMIIETMELQKLENAVCVKTKMKDQQGTMMNLKLMKSYYGEMTDWIRGEQKKNRESELETAFMQELSTFTRFWEVTMKRFREVSQEEMKTLLVKNKDLSNEVCEMMEKVFGFRPPPDKIYNDLLAMRKMALKLRTNETVQFLNFDYFAKRNNEINEQWVKKRKGLLVKLLNSFELRLGKRTSILKQRLKKELDRLHAKRLKQFDQLNTKYKRCKNLLEEVNAKEKMHFEKNKKHFHLRNDVPRLKIQREMSPPSQLYAEDHRDKMSGTYDPNIMTQGSLNRTGTRGGTLIGKSIGSRL